MITLCTAHPVLILLLRRNVGNRPQSPPPSPPIQTPSPYKLDLTSKEQDYLRSVQTIYIGAMDNWPPFDFVNHQNKPCGIGSDLVALLNKRLNGKLKIISGPWNMLYEKTRNKELDALLDISRKPEREPLFYFTNPYLRVPHVIVAQKNKPFIKRIEDLTGKIVALEKDFFTVDYLKIHYPEIAVKEYRDTSYCLGAVERGEADAYIGNRAVATYLIKQELLQNLKIHGRDETQTGSVLSIGTAKDSSILRDILQKALDTISTKEFNSILDRWTGGDRIRLTLTNEEQQFIKTHPKIRVHNEMNWPPFNYNLGGIPQGYSIDVMDLIAEKSGLEVEYISGPSWNDFINMMKNGDLDVMLNIVKTPERQQYLLYTPSYAETPNTILSRREVRYQNLRQLFGKTISIPKGFFHEEILRRDYPRVNLLMVESTFDSMKAVSFGKADAAVGRHAVFNYLLNEHMLTDLVISGELMIGDSEHDRLNIATRKALPLLAAILTKGIEAITMEERQALQVKWLNMARIPVSSPGIGHLTLSPSEKNWLENHGEIRLGVDSARPPFEQIRPDGSYGGMAADYVTLLNERLKINMKPVIGYTRSEVLDKTKKGKLDVIPCLASSPEREEFLVFTSPYLKFQFVIVTPRNAPFISGLTDLSGKNVGVIKGYMIHEKITSDYPDIILTPFETTDKGLKSVAGGELDAFVGDLASITLSMRRHELENVKVISTTEYNFEPAFGVRKEWPELVSILEKGLATVTRQERTAIQDRWINILMQKTVDWSIVWQAVIIVGAIFSCILITVLIWNRRLGKEIIERKRAEGELRKFSRAIDQSQVSVVITDPSGSIEYVNPKFVEVTGYGLKEVIGQNPRLLNSGTHPDKLFRNMWETIKTGNVWVGELANRKKNGELFWESTIISPIRDASGRITHFVAVKEDVTQRKKLEKETLEAKEKAETAARAKSDFLARMSHEIRTPMNAILGMSELLTETDLDFDQRDYIQTLRTSGEMLLAIINDILDISKIEAGHVDLESIGFDIYDLIEEVGRILAPRAREKDLELAHRVISDVPQFLTGDPNRLKQILINLVGNAIKFTRKGSISVEVSPFDHPTHKDRVLFKVQDTGQGIAKDKQQLIFNRFSQADDSITRKFGGTGLGLTICKLLVELMEGHIWVASEMDKGSTFSFTAKLPEAHQAIHQPSASAVDLSFTNMITNKRILVVDDNATNRLLLHDHLTRWGARVNLAEDGEQGLKELKLSAGENKIYDVIFLDIVMEGIGGMEVAERIKTIHPVPPPAVIIATSSDRVADKNRARELGLEGYLAKPIRKQDLIRVLFAVLGDRKPESMPFDVPRDRGIAPGPMTLLLAEDIPANRKVIHNYLKEFPITIVDAENGVDAIEKMNTQNFDMILMDREMPVMDGLTAVRTIRKKEKEKGLNRTPIVELTAHAFGHNRDESIEAGCDEFLTKPVKKNDILRVIAGYQKNASPGSGATAARQMAPEKKKAVCHTVQISKEMEELIPEFFDEVTVEVEKMHSALEERDFKTLKRLAHGYKGASASYEMIYLSKLFKGVESAADIADIDAVGAELSNVKDYIEKVEIEYV